MPVQWDIDKLRKKSGKEIQTLYSHARLRDDEPARQLVAMILDHDLLVEAGGGLPHDHPFMLEIEAVCGEPEAVAEAIAASEAGLPALAGMEYRIVQALGERYGTYNTTNHAGRCIGNAMLARGWKTTVQKPMPAGSVAKTATVYIRKER
jgi:hypothetical protein